MPAKLKLSLSEAQIQELEELRDHAPKPYLRERAAAILKIAEGQSGRQTALQGLLKRHAPDTVYNWVRRYRAEGKTGLEIRSGRGRKPAFSPEYSDREQAREAILHVVHQAPQRFGQNGSRWKLRSLLAVLKWLRLKTLAGLWQLLKRLKIVRKRARAHVHSPDAHYVEKLRRVQYNFLHLDLERMVFLFQDEFTFYRQPSPGYAYEAMGKSQPFAELGWKSNYTWRIAATLNGYTGRVTYVQGGHIGVQGMLQLYCRVCLAYPEATLIFIAQDNWPVHFHPDIRAALQSQDWPWPPTLPPNWPTQPSPKAKRLNLPIRLLPLPTYAPWSNPIEKLWRYLKQEVLHLHRLEDDWSATKLAVTSFLDQFADGSPDLLRYVGLQDPAKLYQALPALSL